MAMSKTWSLRVQEPRRVALRTVKVIDSSTKSLVFTSFNKLVLDKING